MSDERRVHCRKLGQILPGLARPPYPGPLGRRIYEEISAAAWQQWLAHQTMVINELRLNPLDPAARRRLEDEMERFLFQGTAEAPAGYVPPD
jgi:Fe-S cluster biosynthesis and repair protein YggX